MRILADICESMPSSFEEATPHDPANAIAIYGCLAVLVIVPLVILMRKVKHRRAAWWDRSTAEYLRKEAFRQAKERESDRGWNS